MRRKVKSLNHSKGHRRHAAGISGAIIERLGVRKFVMKDLKVHDGHSGAAR